MIQTLFAQVRQYRRASLLAPLFTGLEVLDGGPDPLCDRLHH